MVYHLGKVNPHTGTRNLYTPTRVYPGVCPYCGDTGCGNPNGFTYPYRYVYLPLCSALFWVLCRVGAPNVAQTVWGTLTGE